MVERLFSYGTLRQPEVQRALFGRAVPMRVDRLPGFRLATVLITDPQVVATSGSDRHPILHRGTDDELVEGAWLALDPEELAIADDYEVDDYVRIAVTLESGRSAWVYVAAADA